MRDVRVDEMRGALEPRTTSAGPVWASAHVYSVFSENLAADGGELPPFRDESSVRGPICGFAATPVAALKIACHVTIRPSDSKYPVDL